MPVVSVIIPVFERGGAIDETIESLLHQTLTDWELILVDDGSRDNTPQILRDWEQRDARIRAVLVENQGQNIARNVGLQHAKSDFIHFLDHDDSLFPWTLEEQTALLNSHGGPLVCGPAVGANDAEFSRTFRSIAESPSSTESIVFPDVYSLDDAHHPTCNEILFRAEPLRAAGGFPQRRGTCEEIRLLLAIQLTATNTRCLRHGPRPSLLKRLSHNSLARHYRDNEPSRWPLVTLCEVAGIALKEGLDKEPRFRKRVVDALYPAAVTAWRNGWKPEARQALALAKQLRAPLIGLTPPWHRNLHRILGFHATESLLSTARSLFH